LTAARRGVPSRERAEKAPEWEFRTSGLVCEAKPRRLSRAAGKAFPNRRGTAEFIAPGGINVLGLRSTPAGAVSLIGSTGK